MLHYHGEDVSRDADDASLQALHQKGMIVMKDGVDSCCIVVGIGAIQFEDTRRADYEARERAVHFLEPILLLLLPTPQKTEAKEKEGTCDEAESQNDEARYTAHWPPNQDMEGGESYRHR